MQRVVCKQLRHHQPLGHRLAHSENFSVCLVRVVFHKFKLSCTVYIDCSTCLLFTVLDSKCDYPAACNAMEVLLLHSSLLQKGSFFTSLINALRQHKVSVKYVCIYILRTCVRDFKGVLCCENLNETLPHCNLCTFSLGHCSSRTSATQSFTIEF